MTSPKSICIEDITGDELFATNHGHYVAMKSRYASGTELPIVIELDAPKVDQLIDWLQAWKATQ